MLKTNIVIFSIIALGVIVYMTSFAADCTPEYKFCLRKSYENYKKGFMTKDGRIMDPERGYITTSEGQSYIMLRSVVSSDKKTFDLSYKWAKDNLQRSDSLFAWLWGKNKDGKYMILDNNTASDADVDIAFSLLLAYEKWGNYNYLREALPIIISIWNNETRKVGNFLVLMPGVEQTFSEQIEINPSYFSPYAFRFFQKYDEIHDWSFLIDSSYYYLEQVTSVTQSGLPPNWFLIDETNGGEQIILEDSERSDFSYDAIRVFARVYLDYIRTGEKRALPILAKTQFFINKWQETGEFYTNYKANGELRDKNKFLGSISILIPVIEMYNAEVASAMYRKELEPLLNNEKYFASNYDYYNKNLLWFGCYLNDKNTEEHRYMHRKRIVGY